MVTNAWLKYLPVFRIVLKKSLHSEQKFFLNAADFTRAGYTRKLGYKFLIKLKDGRLSNIIVDMPIAATLANLLHEDKVLQGLLLENEFHISLDTKFGVTIRHIPQMQLHEEPAP